MEKKKRKILMHLIFLFTLLSIIKSNMLSNDFYSFSAGTYANDADGWYSKNFQSYTVVNSFTQGISLMHDPFSNVCHLIEGLNVRKKYNLTTEFGVNIFPQPPADSIELKIVFGDKYRLVDLSSIENHLTYFIQLSFVPSNSIVESCWTVQIVVENVRMTEASDVVIDYIEMQELPSSQRDVIWTITAGIFDLYFTIDTDLKEFQTVPSTIREQFMENIKFYINFQEIPITATILTDNPFSFIIQSQTQIDPNQHLILQFQQLSIKINKKWIWFNINPKFMKQYWYIGCTLLKQQVSTMQILTNLTFLSQWETILNSSIVIVKINKVPIQNISIGLRNQTVDGVQISLISIIVETDQSYKKDLPVTMQIKPNILPAQNGNKIVFNVTVEGLTPQLLINNEEENEQEEQIQILNDVANIIPFFFQIWNLISFNYFIKNIVIFYRLSIFSFLHPIQALISDHRHSLSRFFLQYNTQKLNIQPLNIQQWRLTSQKFPQEVQGYHWLKYYGYSSDFVQSIGQQLINLFYFPLKLIVIKLLTYISFIKQPCLKILQLKFSLFYFQLVIITPRIAVFLAYISQSQSNFGFNNRFQKINVILITLFLFFCLKAAFLSHFHFNKKWNLKQIMKTKQTLEKITKQNIEAQLLIEKVHRIEKKDQIKNVKSIFIVNSLDNLMLFIFPFSGAFFNISIFFTFQTILTCLRLIMVLWVRKFYKKNKFFGELYDKVIWIVYNLSYLILINSTNSIIGKKLGAAIIYLMYFAILFYIIIFVINLVIFLKDLPKKKRKRIKPSKNIKPIKNCFTLNIRNINKNMKNQVCQKQNKCVKTSLLKMLESKYNYKQKLKLKVIEEQ